MRLRPVLVLLALLCACVAPAQAAPVQRASFEAAPATFTYRIGPGQLLRVTVPVRGQIALPRRGRDLPVVVVMHGRHQWCEPVSRGTRHTTWRCSPGEREVRSYAGYTYLLEALAARGFAVVSVSVNAATAVEDVSGSPPAVARAGTCPTQTCSSLWRGMDFRGRVADVVLRRLGSASAGSGRNPFGLPLRGRLDLGRVGLVGHSRGGEGVVTAAALFDRSTAYAIKGVFVISPVDFKGRIVPDDVAFGSVISYCDGDVSDQQGIWFLDDIARRERRTRAAYQVVALGANHNFFNRIWGDEWGPPGGFARGWCGRGDAESGRLARPAQERLLTSLVTPFMEREVAGRAVSVAALGAGAAPPRRLAGAPVTSVWLPPAARRVRLLGPGATLRTPRGADLVARGFSRVAVCSFKEICGGMRRETFPRSVDALHLRWTAAGATLAIPVARADADARAARLLAFRIAVEPQPPPAIIFEGSEEPPPPPLPDDVNPQPLGTPQSLTVRVRDRAGASAAVVVPPTAAALRYPPAPGSTARAILGHVRLPLAAFAGVDLRRLAAVELVFDRTPAGSVFVSDVELIR